MSTTRLLEAFTHAAARTYDGEAVSELEHSLQCAELAAAAGADDDLLLACLLHDVGRFAVDQRWVHDRITDGAAPSTARGHHELGAEFIAPYVGERVAWLVRTHADAKRYLCAVEPGYFARLSAVSRHTMTLQGGIMCPDDVDVLAAHPWVEDVLRLRRWDDSAKVPGKVTRPLSTWEPFLRRWFA